LTGISTFIDSITINSSPRATFAPLSIESRNTLPTAGLFISIAKRSLIERDSRHGSHLPALKRRLVFSGRLVVEKLNQRDRPANGETA
jgi:hypothetical protein